MAGNQSVGIRSLALKFPSVIRTNDAWKGQLSTHKNRQRPRVYSRNRQSSSSHSISSDQKTSDQKTSGLKIWSQEVSPYLADPFKGSVERRWLGPDDDALTLECEAATAAIEAAELLPEQVDMVVVTSIFSNHIGHYDASHLVQKLGLQAPAWNLESTCSSALVALETASALVAAGGYHHILVVVSHMGSNVVSTDETLSLSMGDGVGAFVVQSLEPNYGLLGRKIVNTAVTRGAHDYALKVTDSASDAKAETAATTQASHLEMRTGENANMLAETAVDFVRLCCNSALADAEVLLEEIDFFLFNTPTAWHSKVCCRALGISPDKTFNLYPCYANIGPVFPVANLYHATQLGKIKEGDLVLVYTLGAAATAVATVMRWGNVGLGASPVQTDASLNILSKKVLSDLPIGDRSDNQALFSLSDRALTDTKLLATEPEHRERLIEAHLFTWLADTLKVSPAELKGTQALSFLLDSLTTLALRGQIETDLKINLPMEAFVGTVTIAQLAERINTQFALMQLTCLETEACDKSSSLKQAADNPITEKEAFNRESQSNRLNSETLDTEIVEKETLFF